MTPFLDRYLQGQHKQVWKELIALGDQVRQEPLYTDALAVARETMRRVRFNIEWLINALESLGYEFWMKDAASASTFSEEIPDLLEEPLPDIERHLSDLEQAGVVLPLSVRAFYERVGAVNFAGLPTAHPSEQAEKGVWGSTLPRDQYGKVSPDDFFRMFVPLLVHSLDDLRADYLLYQRHERASAYWSRRNGYDDIPEVFEYSLLPSAGNLYGASQDRGLAIRLPHQDADAALLSAESDSLEDDAFPDETAYWQEHRLDDPTPPGGHKLPPLTFVSYLRYTFEGAGFFDTGLAGGPLLTEVAFQKVSRGLLPI